MLKRFMAKIIFNIQYSILKSYYITKFIFDIKKDLWQKIIFEFLLLTKIQKYIIGKYLVLTIKLFFNLKLLK